MGNLSNFNASEHQSDKNYEPLNGQYTFGILDAEVEVMDENRTRLKIQLQVTSQKDNNRVQYDRIWLKHQTSSQAQEIGLQRLSSLLYAAGIPDADDTSELIGRTIEAICGPQKSNPQYGEVKKYLLPKEDAKPAESSIQSIPDDLF